jgi:hypothetical protein
VSPPRRCPAVDMRCAWLGLSQRHACQITGQHRWVSPAQADPDKELWERLRRFARECPRWGTGGRMRCWPVKAIAITQEDPVSVAAGC